MRVAALALALLFAAGNRTVTFRIEGMSCEPCASAIEIQLGETAGVTSYTVSFEDAEARVGYDPALTTPEKIASSIGVTGFRAFVKPATPPEALPESLEPLTAAFNAARGRARLIAILSPSSDAQPLQRLLADGSAPAAALFVVWSPLSAVDDEAAARESAERVSRTQRVRQFWDPSRRVREAFREDGNACLFFGGDAHWSAPAPKPERAVRP
jgi:copper chaperone CopZ